MSEIGIDASKVATSANPVDTKFFSNPPDIQNTLFTALNDKKAEEVDNDPGLASLINANTPVCCRKILGFSS